MRTTTVEIWSDVVCPWCAIGKARFDAAVQQLDDPSSVQVRWRSFELDPHAPRTRDGDYATMLAAKYRTSRDQAQAMIDRMVETAAAEGLEFRFDIAKPGNTFDAHRVVHLAADRGLQLQVKDRFLRGYHSEGAAIGDHGEITRMAVEAGLDEGEVRDVLAGDAHADAVRADEEQARAHGIGGVPFFVLDGGSGQRVGVSGAQPADVLLDALQRVRPAEPLAEVIGVGADGVADVDACGIDGC